jgi:hypothetical protein
VQQYRQVPASDPEDSPAGTCPEIWSTGCNTLPPRNRHCQTSFSLRPGHRRPHRWLAVARGGRLNADVAAEAAPLIAAMTVPAHPSRWYVAVVARSAPHSDTKARRHERRPGP